VLYNQWAYCQPQPANQQTGIGSVTSHKSSLFSPQERQDLDARIAAIIHGNELKPTPAPVPAVEPDLYDPAKPTEEPEEEEETQKESSTEKPKEEKQPSDDEEQVIDDDELHNLLGV